MKDAEAARAVLSASLDAAARPARSAHTERRAGCAGWMEEWMDGSSNESISGWMEGWMSGWMDGWMDEVDGWMDG